LTTAFDVRITSSWDSDAVCNVLLGQIFPSAEKLEADSDLLVEALLVKHGKPLCLES
jgi:hypothetical protein